MLRSRIERNLEDANRIIEAYGGERLDADQIFNEMSVLTERLGPFIAVALKITPQALANLSPRLERSDNLGDIMERKINPERVWRLANPFRVLIFYLGVAPGFSFLEPWAKISERLRRKFERREIRTV